MSSAVIVAAPCRLPSVGLSLRRYNRIGHTSSAQTETPDDSVLVTDKDERR